MRNLENILVKQQIFFVHKECKGRKYKYGNKILLIIRNLHTFYVKPFINRLIREDEKYEKWNICKGNIPFDFLELRLVVTFKD